MKRIPQVRFERMTINLSPVKQTIGLLPGILVILKECFGEIFWNWINCPWTQALCMLRFFNNECIFQDWGFIWGSGNFPMLQAEHQGGITILTLSFH